MTIQQLRYFLALCEDLNYTHTAGRMIQFNSSSPYANARRRIRAWLRDQGL